MRETLIWDYHPTSEITNKPPEIGDEEIEGAWSALPPDDRPQEGADMRTETADEAARYPPADEIMTAESRYGNPEAEDEMHDVDVDDANDYDYNIVVEETYYEQGEEELDYDNEAPVEEDMPVREDDQRPDNSDGDINADDEEEGDHVATKSFCPKKGKDAPVWGQLGTPVGDRKYHRHERLARPPN